LADIISDLLDEEVRAARDFLSLLEREKLALQGGPIDGLFALAEEKSNLCSRSNRLAIKRAQAFAMAGAGTQRKEIETFLRSTRQPALVRWHELLTLAGKIRGLNRDNGTLILSQLQHHQQALAVLRGAAEQAALYGPDGQSHSVPQGRHFGSA
jgi:flagellar biosynthesis/type III secretory pathway chaperone